MKRVYLGGTCNGSRWRDSLIPLLEIDYFNPVVENWSEENYQNELLEREQADFCLYVITPKMSGLYSIAEVVDDSNKRPEKTVMVLLAEDEGESFTEHQLKALKRVATLIERNGAAYYESLNDAASFLNGNILHPARSNDIPPLAISIEEFDDAIKALFSERFGGYDTTNPRHVGLRRKLCASACTSDTDESIIIVHGENADALRRWSNRRKS